MNLLGHHHLTAIASDAQKNHKFYTDVLGLRLVKTTINFDDPSAYHLYYGDGVGSPGTILTFFIWKGAFAGRAGVGQAAAVALSIPQASLGYWLTRLQDKGIKTIGPLERFGEKFLLIQDPDGMTVELVADAELRPFSEWEGSVPMEHAIRGLHGVTVLEGGYEDTADFLTKELGMKKLAEEHGVHRFQFGSKRKGFIYLKVAPEYFPATMGTGTIHHIAFGAKNDKDQKAFHEALKHHGHNVSPIMERVYFRSIYFREPGGVLFEIATDAPGFTVDETKEKLGSSLRLPPWMEQERSSIEAALPPFNP